MKKKILTLLVLLMTAVTGAWATDYYVVGSMTGWQKNDQYKMTLNASAATTEYQLGIALAATDEFKVIGEDGDNPWVWYPCEANYVVNADGLYTVYFRPNRDGGDDWHANCIYLAEGAYLSATSGVWSLAMPSSDVELEVEYYPLATLATLPAAAEGVVEGTDAALLTPGTSAEGTLAYAIGTSEAPTGQWSDAIPTAQDLAAGTCYVWYKVVGNAEHSDSQPQSIAVTIAEAPAYAVTIDDAGVDASNWQATPAEPKTGQTVTLSYSGKKKIRSITIEAANVPVESITLNKTATEITVGQTETLSVTEVLPANATDLTYTWKTSDETKATVDQDGKVTAVAAGTVNIYAEANDGSGVQGTCAVTVKAAATTVTWNNSDLTNLVVLSGMPFTKDGITLSVDQNSQNVAMYSRNSIAFQIQDANGYTFTAPSGKKFTKIEMTLPSGDQYLMKWINLAWMGLGSGWSSAQEIQTTGKVTWTGNASSVDLLKPCENGSADVSSFVFTLE